MKNKQQKRHLDSKSLSVFLAVCEKLNMSHAAKKLGMTQPAVTQQIQTLEQTIGKSLIDRDVRPLQLTQAGKILQQQAPIIIEQIDKTIALLYRCKGKKIPELTIGITTTFPGYVLPLLIKHLSKYVEKISMHSDISQQLIQRFLDRELDMILSATRIEEQTKIEEHHLITEPMVALYPANYFRAQHKPTLQELIQQIPLINFPGNCHLYSLIQQYIRSIGSEVKQRMEVSSATEAMIMVEAGMGWTITTPLLVTVGNRNHAIEHTKNILLPKPGITRDIFLYAQANELGDLPEQSLAFLKTALKEHSLPDILKLTPCVKNYIII